MIMAVRLDELELRHLHALRAVATAGTFSKAAATLGYTQSAVSQQIAALERVVGSPVFDRPGGPRPVRLTPAGELLLRHAGDVLAEVAAAEMALNDLLAGETGEVRLGTFQSTSVRLVPNLVSCLRERRPGVTVRLVESDEDDELQRMLRAGELDLSFLLRFVADDLVCTHVLTDPFVLLAPLDSPIVPASGGVPIERLNGLPLIGQATNACQGLIEDQLDAAGIDTNIVFRSGDNAAIQALVAAGTGHAIQPLLAVDTNDTRILVRDLEPPLVPREIHLAHLDGRNLSPVVAEIVELTVTYCRDGEPFRT
jgi:DNA-binding transcriptional LysR family regulator